MYIVCIDTLYYGWFVYEVSEEKALRLLKNENKVFFVFRCYKKDVITLKYPFKDNYNNFEINDCYENDNLKNSNIVRIVCIGNNIFEIENIV
jgi:hypothetical protein